MPVFPYKQHPKPPLVAVLLEGGQEVTTEEDGIVALGELPERYRVWGSWSLVNELWGDGIGEAMCWQGRPVRWRHERHPDDVGWINRHTDVRCSRIGWPDDEGKALEGLVAWRDWLADHGASPMGSLGSSAFSLLRASLDRPLWTSVGWKGIGAPIEHIMGSRQEMGAEMGRYEPGRHYDLPAAYAQALGAMRYGGHWTEVGKAYPYGMVARRGVLCFVRARVAVPSDLPFGPLPRRPKRAPKRADALFSFNVGRYPVGKTIQGVWTWEELDAAEAVGCKVRALQVWIHMSPDDRYPFRPWWETIQEGREKLKGWPGLLAKATGNALWGQFVITPGAERTRQHWSGSRRYPKRTRHPLPLPGSSPHYAPDLAETLTGRVRADLYRAMMKVGKPTMLCAHTDGLWTQGEVDGMTGGWRAKLKAARVDVVTPQFIRYYRTLASPPEYVMAGCPPTLAPALFEHVWDGFVNDGRIAG